MIKRLADACRGREGYAGMAVYHNGMPLFYDAMGPDLAEKSRRLFEECEAVFKARSMAAVIRGFTVATFRTEGLLVVCRLEGRFTQVPAPAEEDTAEYATGSEEARRITREEAKREAELILRHLLGTG